MAHDSTTRLPWRCKLTRLAVVLAALAASACEDATPAIAQAEADAPAVPAYAAFDYDQLRRVHPTSAAAALAFLDTLSADHRAEAVLDFNDSRRSRWSNLPPSMFLDRNGVALGDLAAIQVEAAHRFLATALSADGYAMAMAVVGAEDQLAEDSFAGGLLWSSGNYWLAFFGEPSAAGEAPWGWQFGGHHLAINITVAGGRSYLSPTFVGIEPAQYTGAAGVVAPFSEHLAGGIALIDALDEAQRGEALAETRPRELATGAGKDGLVPAVEGSAVGGWNSAQQQQLLDLVALWTRMMPTDSAAARLEEVRADLGETYFAWHGSASDADGIYYRVHGPRLIIEFATQGQVSADGGHYHAIYRDPTNEYGSLLRGVPPRAPAATG